MPGRLILELKYRGAPPAVFRQLVEEFALRAADGVEVSARRRREWPGRTRPARAGRRNRTALCLSSCEESCRRQAPRSSCLGASSARCSSAGVVAWIYRRTRPASDTSSSLSVTLVLLSILIAMVTQVIGDNVARAFSLVGALSIVRFRTVVRDTADTAFVIFAVAVGMAAGAGHPSVALSGIAVVGVGGLVHDERRQPAVESEVTVSAPGAGLASGTTSRACWRRPCRLTSAAGGWSPCRPRSRAWRSRPSTGSSSRRNSRPGARESPQPDRGRAERLAQPGNDRRPIAT